MSSAKFSILRIFAFLRFSASVNSFACPVLGGTQLSVSNSIPLPKFLSIPEAFNGSVNMTATLHGSTVRTKSMVAVRPSKVDPATSKPFTLDQELKPFGTWVDSPIWVPPKDSSTEMAESMLRQSGLLTPRSKSWSSLVEEHRDSFTQVREIELAKASIRLPKGRLFVSVTEQKHFDEITDTIPNCVQTRLEEFMDGPGKQRGVKVSYLKPLCVEVEDDLHFTSREDIFAAIDKIQQEVFSEYRRLYLSRRSKQAMIKAMNRGLAMPRAIAKCVIQHRQRAVDAYQAKLEFQRRKIALRQQEPICNVAPMVVLSMRCWR